ARHDHQVRLPRRGAERLRPEPADVDAGRRGGDHLDRAARQPKLGRPDRVAAAPADQLAEGRGQKVLAERLGEGLYSQSRPPLRQMWARAMPRMPMKTSISIRPNHFSWRTRRAKIRTGT